MARDTKYVTQLTVVIPKGRDKAIKALAKVEGKSISEYVRSLIERDAATKQFPLDLTVAPRGGYRTPTPDDSAA